MVLETKIVINKVVYKNDEATWFVTRGRVGSEEASIVGALPFQTRVGSELMAKGTWETHSRFGRQFKVEAAIEEVPGSAQALKAYLSSGVIKGIGPITAERIVSRFGENTRDVLTNDPEQLLTISGVGEKTLDEIKSNWETTSVHREALLFFLEHGISASLANRVLKSLGGKAVNLVKTNPYLLLKTTRGIGFKTVDQMAEKLGIEPDAPERIIEALVYCLGQAGASGHVYLPKTNLVRETARLTSLDTAVIENQLEKLANDSRVVVEQERYYPEALHRHEQNIASHIRLRLENNYQPTDALLAKAKNICQNTFPVYTPKGVQMAFLSEAQKEAVMKVTTEQFLIITGGPGCGKTTVLRSALEVLRYGGLNTMLASPTGKAAQRMSEVTGVDASTIHRLLKFDPFNNSFTHNRENPLNCDVLIIDESSMLDISLGSALFDALLPTTKLILVGDSDQLPSVGPGKMLLDLLSSSKIPSVRLNTLFRQDERSSIVNIAHDINSSVVPDVPAPDALMKDDAYFIEIDDPEPAANMIERLVYERIPDRFGTSIDDILILTPSKKGPLGNIALNKKLQKRFTRENAASFTCGEQTFLLGDRVCQTVNNYNIHKDGVFNGDQGHIVGIDTANQSVTVRLWDGREIVYDKENTFQLSLAWALTVHKSQGSESKIVVLALHKSHTILLERQLLYTAVTRAKEKLFIVGQRSALKKAVLSSSGRERFTSLREKI